MFKGHAPDLRPRDTFRRRRHAQRMLLSACASMLAVTGLGAVPALAAARSQLDLSSVVIKVATYPYEGDDVLLGAAGLAKTPYKVQYQDLASGALQTQAVNAGIADI